MGRWAAIRAVRAFVAALLTLLVPHPSAMLLDVVTGREPRTFQGEPYEEIAVLGGLMLILGLWLANKFEHSEALVVSIILATMASVFALRLLVVKYGLRSYRLRT